ncbi:MAG: ATP-binding protein [Casimicrobiaceae bacterium]
MTRSPPRHGAAATVFEDIFAEAPDAILIVGPDGRIRLANPAADRLFEAHPGRLAGHMIEDLIPPALRPEHRALRERYSERPMPRPMGLGMQLRAASLKGREFPVEVSLAPSGSASRDIICIVRDVTERVVARRTERELRRAQALAQISLQCLRQGPAVERSRDVLKALRSALVADLAVRFVRAEGDDLLCSDAEGDSADGIAGARVSLDAAQVAAQVLATGVPLLVGDTSLSTTTVCQLMRAQGFACLAAAPVVSEDAVEGVLVVANRQAHSLSSDDLAFVEAAANILASALLRTRTEAQLQQSQRLEAIGQLTGGIAHDFNNLLTVISGNLQILEDQLGGDAFARRAIEASRRATRRGAELTAKLLAFSRRQTLQPRAVDVAQLLHGFVQLLGRTLGGAIEIVVETPAEADGPPPVALVDAGQLETALLNLALNARDAMPCGGRLTLSVDCVPPPPEARGSVIGAGSLNGRCVRVRVQDTGEGMSASTRERAFEPFFTTKAPGKGSGLGLSMVYGFIRQSAGHITLESAPGQGTCVTLYLPHAGARLPATRAGATAATTTTHALNVLVIEDDPDVQSVLAHQLRALGCQPVVAANRRQALARLRQRPEIDVAISDVVLERGETGPQVIRALRRKRPDLPVIYTSGYARDALPLRLDDADADGFLRKPWTVGELVQALTRATERRSGAGSRGSSA